MKNIGRYEDFVQAVRRFRQTDLLELVASVATRLDRTGQQALPDGRGGVTPITQFSLAAVAKESVVRGNDHRSAIPEFRDLLRLCDRYMNAGDAFDTDEPGFLGRLLVQTAFEQFPWQLSLSEELGRTWALYIDAARSYGSELINENTWREFLGCSLSDYVGAIFLWHVGAMKHDGRVEPNWVDQENFRTVTEVVNRDVLISVLNRLTATPRQLRDIASSVPMLDRKYRRFGFNPLQARPIVLIGPNNRHIAPQPLYVIRKATATGVFYQAIEVMGKDFSDELGHIFEHYVGLQLRDIDGIEVFDEIVFGKEEERSVDYFIESRETLILVEVKSTRLTSEARVAGPRLVDDLQRGIGKAFDQIDRSANCIRNSHPAFAHLPQDRRLAGLVVTLEPYFVTHTPDIRSFVGRAPSVPTVVAAVRELEHLVAVGAESDAPALLDMMYATPEDAGGAFAQLGHSIADVPYGENPMLKRAWAAYPWRT